MSDYFGALMRSAGSVPADAGLRAVTSDPAVPPAQGDHLVEQHVEVDAGAPREPARVASLPAPLARLEQQAVVHPAVRAALRWVADPGPTSSAPARSVAQQPASIAIERPDSPSPIHNDTLSSRPRPADPLPKPRIAQEMDLSLPPQRTRPAATATVDRPVPTREQRVDVSIGTVHVSVDAPQPRVVAQPAPPAPRPMPARPAERSGFSRCRLPRI